MFGVGNPNLTPPTHINRIEPKQWAQSQITIKLTPKLKIQLDFHNAQTAIGAKCDLKMIIDLIRLNNLKLTPFRNISPIKSKIPNHVKQSQLGTKNHQSC